MNISSPNTSLFVRIRDGLAWRLHGILGDRIVYGSLRRAARAWRNIVLTRTIFIGVTGSAGKTTTKELLVGMLGKSGRAAGNRSSYNFIDEISKSVLQLSPLHDYFISEISGHKPGVMDLPLSFLRPTIGIVTVVRNDHGTAFANSVAAIAEEKSKLIKQLPKSGTAVLNADDELVLGMAKFSKGRVLTYGLSPSADLRADNVSSVWPQRLEFDLHYQGATARVRTQLCGTHWIPSVLGAIGGGLAAGRTLAECVRDIEQVPAFDGRMEPYIAPNGVAFIRDDFKAPYWTLDSCFDFVRAARAKRKIVVIGTLSDGGPLSAGTMYTRVARQVQEFADIAIFIGPWASHVLKLRDPARPDALLVFNRVVDAANYIHENATEGDLVLLKGTNKQDHLLRIPLLYTNNIQCWLDNCRRFDFCTVCQDRLKPQGQRPSDQRERIAIVEQIFPEVKLEAKEQVIVGLGNPQAERNGSPHNAGYEVVDHIARSLGLSWQASKGGWLARGDCNGVPVSLLKINAAMNHIGPLLQDAADALGFAHAQCILVYDDLDSPLGVVRGKQRGGSAGHRGVASILEVFQTADIRRIKVGVKPEQPIKNKVDYVLTPLQGEQRAALMGTMDAAQKLVFDMVRDSTRVKAPKAEAAQAAMQDGP